MLRKIALLGIVAKTLAAACSGSADPTAFTCYMGSKSKYGMTVIIKVDVGQFANGIGTMSLRATGPEGVVTCGYHSFIKSGQEIKVDNWENCFPPEITSLDINYCSGTDTFTVALQDSFNLPVSGTLYKQACPPLQCQGPLQHLLPLFPLKFAMHMRWLDVVCWGWAASGTMAKPIVPGQSAIAYPAIVRSMDGIV